MGNKQEELEVLVYKNRYDNVVFIETWWDGSHDWNILLEGYKLLNRNRSNKREDRVLLYERITILL